LTDLVRGYRGGGIGREPALFRQPRAEDGDEKNLKLERNRLNLSNVEPSRTARVPGTGAVAGGDID
jgi:hypothetical protein